MTNSECIAKLINESSDKRVETDIRTGAVEQMVDERKIRGTQDRYICDAVDDDDWVPEGDQSWAGVAGRTLDPVRVKAARNEEIDEYRKH